MPGPYSGHRVAIVVPASACKVGTRGVTTTLVLLLKF